MEGKETEKSHAGGQQDELPPGDRTREIEDEHDRESIGKKLDRG
jgi:hypothetical protein